VDTSAEPGLRGEAVGEECAEVADDFEREYFSEGVKSM